MVRPDSAPRSSARIQPAASIAACSDPRAPTGRCSPDHPVTRHRSGPPDEVAGHIDEGEDPVQRGSSRYVNRTQNATRSSKGQPGRMPSRMSRYASQSDAKPANAKKAESILSIRPGRRRTERRESAMPTVWPIDHRGNTRPARTTTTARPEPRVRPRRTPPDLHEAGVVARQHDRLLPQLSGQRLGGPSGDLGTRGRTHRDPNADRSIPQRGDVGCVAGERLEHPQEEQLVVRLLLGRRLGRYGVVVLIIGGAGGWPGGRRYAIGRHRAVVHDERAKTPRPPRSRRTGRRLDGVHRGTDRGGIRKQVGDRRLRGDHVVILSGCLLAKASPATAPPLVPITRRVRAPARPQGRPGRRPRSPGDRERRVVDGALPHPVRVVGDHRVIDRQVLGQGPEGPARHRLTTTSSSGRSRGPRSRAARRSPRAGAGGADRSPPPWWWVTLPWLSPPAAGTTHRVARSPTRQIVDQDQPLPRSRPRVAIRSSCSSIHTVWQELHGEGAPARVAVRPRAAPR